MKIRELYLHHIRKNCSNPVDKEHVLLYWRNKLFCTTIIYLLPLSLIALIPGLYWIYHLREFWIGLADVLTVISLVLVAFLPGVQLVVRKIIFISCSYFFSIAILYFVGFNGPGLIYLLGCCIFSILIFSTSRVYWSAWLNTLICVGFAILIAYDLMPEDDMRIREIGEWIAVSTNLIFLSFLCAALIPPLFKGMEKSFEKEILLKEELESEKENLQELSNALRDSLDENTKTMDSSLDVICKIDGEGRFVKVSAACKEVWGYTADELIGMSAIDLVYPEDQYETIRVSEQIKSGKNVTDFENRYIHKNGSLVPISWSVRMDEEDHFGYAVARNITEKLLLENEVELEKKRFYELLLEAPMSIGMLSGPGHVYQIVNPLYLKLIDKTDIIGKRVIDVLPDVEEQGLIDMLDHVYKTGESFYANEKLIRLEIEGVLRDHYLNFSYQARLSRTGEIDGIFFFAVDVTEQVLSRRKVEKSELRLNDAQAIARMGNWEVDLINQTHYWSDEIYELFGLLPGELMPSEETFMAFVHPDDIADAYVSINHGLEIRENINFYFRFIRKDGKVRHAFNQWKFKLDSERNPEILMGIMQDVTEQKEVEQHLKHTEAFSRGVLNSLNSNIAVIDLNGSIVAVNESWTQFGLDNGATSIQGIGVRSNYFDVCEKAIEFGVEYAEEACNGIKAVLNGRKDLFYLEYACHSAIENRWFGMRAMRFEGDVPLAVISHSDISDRKLAEIERSDLVTTLLHRNKDLEQFTYIVSHNLRAPLANILGMLTILESPEMPDTERIELSKVLYESADKLDDVVKDLNMILQIRDQKNEWNEFLSFSQLVEDIKISLGDIINDDISIIYDFSAVNKFSTLKSYMYSIFHNLISNSIKYRRDVACEIRIRSELSDHKLSLYFADNSLGIDLKKRGDQIFGLYKKFHSNVEGKGLGLFMVKVQVDKLGGKIEVKSEVGIGTEFRIEFDYV